MAERGTPTFNTENAEAWNSHAKLLQAQQGGLSDAELAAKFQTTVPTVRKWLRLPLGYKPGLYGRPRKEVSA